LTISVSSGVATGDYTLTVTGTSGVHSHSAMMTVHVPGQDFSFAAVPTSITIVRGGTVAADLNLASIGNFAGTISFSTVVAPVPGQTDNDGVTNNVTPGYSPAMGTLTAGGSDTVAFFASTIGGISSINPSYTATGNYTATITASSGSLSHSAVISFTVVDFSIGPSYCTGNNFVQTSPDSLSATVFDGADFGGTGTDIAGQLIGTPCSSLTITDQPNPIAPYFSIYSSPAQILWVQSNALGGFTTNGWDGLPSVSALNPALPFNGIEVPQLAGVLTHDRVCMAATFWANGTQIPYSYLAANGPIIIPASGLYPVFAPAASNWGCRFDGAVYPRDVGNDPELNDAFGGTTFQNINNPDFWGVTAMSLVGTLAGSYTFKLCANNGSVQHCETYTLNVIHAPTVNQLTYTHKLSIGKTGGVQNFKVGINNPDSHTIYAQVTITAIGSLGDTFTVTSSVVTIAPSSSATNIPLSITASPSMIGETFTFSTSVAVGLDSVNLDGTSTKAGGPVLHGSFTVVP